VILGNVFNLDQPTSQYDRRINTPRTKAYSSGFPKSPLQPDVVDHARMSAEINQAMQGLPALASQPWRIGPTSSRQRQGGSSHKSSCSGDEFRFQCRPAFRECRRICPARPTSSSQCALKKTRTALDPRRLISQYCRVSLRSGVMASVIRRISACSCRYSV